MKKNQSKLIIYLDNDQDTKEFNQQMNKLMIINKISLKENWNFEIINNTKDTPKKKLFSGICFIFNPKNAQKKFLKS